MVRKVEAYVTDGGTYFAKETDAIDFERRKRIADIMSRYNVFSKEPIDAVVECWDILKKIMEPVNVNLVAMAGEAGENEGMTQKPPSNPAFDPDDPSWGGANVSVRRAASLHAPEVNVNGVLHHPQCDHVKDMRERCTCSQGRGARLLVGQ
jgi:hypothetical protein